MEQKLKKHQTRHLATSSPRLGQSEDKVIGSKKKNQKQSWFLFWEPLMKEIFKCHVSWFKLPPARTQEPMVTEKPGMCIDRLHSAR